MTEIQTSEWCTCILNGKLNYHFTNDSWQIGASNYWQSYPLTVWFINNHCSNSNHLGFHHFNTKTLFKITIKEIIARFCASIAGLEVIFRLTPKEYQSREFVHFSYANCSTQFTLQIRLDWYNSYSYFVSGLFAEALIIDSSNYHEL